MTAIMDLSFPCIHDSVYMPGPRAGRSENGFFRCDTWLQIFQNDSKICKAEVTLTPLINKICKAWGLSLRYELGTQQAVRVRIELKAFALQVQHSNFSATLPSPNKKKSQGKTLAPIDSSRKSQNKP